MSRGGWLAAAFVVAALAAKALADDGPGGPRFGNGRVTSALVAVAGVADLDVYEAPLIAGERLSVVLAAAPGLEPTLDLVDPHGQMVGAATQSSARRLAL